MVINDITPLVVEKQLKLALKNVRSHNKEYVLTFLCVKLFALGCLFNPGELDKIYSVCIKVLGDQHKEFVTHLYNAAGNDFYSFTKMLNVNIKYTVVQNEMLSAFIGSYSNAFLRAIITADNLGYESLI